MRIEIPPKAEIVVNKLIEAGFDAYVVGGCVRDSILGREPQDWDITTSAKPEQVKELFSRTIDTGIAHGTVTVMIDKEGFEVTTYRIDGKYEDGRHPTEVSFTPNLSEDLKRRDFTINAMAYNHQNGLIDLFGGMEDIENKVIRCVGNATERFNEDALRMMRAVRFSAQLGYEIEENTKAAIRLLAENLKKISAERIQVELVKLLLSDHPDYLRIAYETGITAVVLPELDCCMDTPQNHPHHKYNVGEHILMAIKSSPADRCIRLAMLFHDIGKPATKTTDSEGIDHFHNHQVVSEEMAKNIMKRLKFDNDTIHLTCKYVRYHDEREVPTQRIVRRAINRIGEEAFPNLFAVRRADILAQSEYKLEEKLGIVEQWEEIYAQVSRQEQCVSMKTLAITGNDLIAEGFTPGKEMGTILKKLLEQVLDDPEKNQKEYLLKQAKEML